MIVHRPFEHEKEECLDIFPITKNQAISLMAIALRRHRCERGAIGRIAAGLWIAVMFLVVASGQAKAEDPHLGLTEYELSCMPCHGIDGRGDGPRAKSLKWAPADLTKIAKSNKGQFPARKLAEIIDGRAIAGAHGQREMPVWGDRYRVRTEANEPVSAIDRRARAQITALVEYFRRIQEK